MYVYTSNLMVELMARSRYWYLCHIKKVQPIEHIEYHHRHWYKLDRHCRIVKISLTYFELMQPKSAPHLQD